MHSPCSRQRSKPRRLVGQQESEAVAVLWRLLAVTAPRLSELLGVRWPEVDLDQGFITLENSVVRKPRKGVVLRLGTLKSNASRRPLALDPETVRLLRVHRKRQSEERLACPGREDHDLVFTREDGSPLAPEWVTRRFNALVEQIGLPPTGTVGRYGPHGLRYTRASNAAHLGEHPTVTGAVLGHAYQSPTTQSSYTRVPPEDLKKAAVIVAGILAGQ